MRDFWFKGGHVLLLDSACARMRLRVSLCHASHLGRPVSPLGWPPNHFRSALARLSLSAHSTPARVQGELLVGKGLTEQRDTLGQLHAMEGLAGPAQNTRQRVQKRAEA